MDALIQDLRHAVRGWVRRPAFAALAVTVVALGIGLALGLAGALGVTRVLRGLLFGVSALDPLTFAAVALLLLAVSLAAVWLPARRATRLDPTTVLRAE